MADGQPHVGQRHQLGNGVHIGRRLRMRVRIEQLALKDAGHEDRMPQGDGEENALGPAAAEAALRTRQHGAGQPQGVGQGHGQLFVSGEWNAGDVAGWLAHDGAGVMDGRVGEGGGQQTDGERKPDGGLKGVEKQVRVGHLWVKCIYISANNQFMKHLDTDRNSARIIVQVELVIRYDMY